MLGSGMPDLEQPSYEELAARNAELAARVAELLAVVAEQAALIGSLRAEVAALRRQAGRDSSNSSQPPSQDGPAAKAKAGRREARRARPGRPQGGQKGHPGASLAWTARPDETLQSSRVRAAGAARTWPALRAGSRPACRWSISRRPR
jgi:transposase